MSRTTRFREQHADLLELAAELQKIAPQQLSPDAAPARSLLSKFLGKLSLHLAIEDRSLYPEFEESTDAKISSMATRFETAMGGVAEKTLVWSKRWPTPAAIQAQPDRFVAKTAVILATLKNRMHRKNQKLHPALGVL